MNPEDEPIYLKLPSICLEIVLDNPFIFDLIKSETFDWETNDRIYTTNMKKSRESSDPALGILSGILNYQILINQQQDIPRSIFHKYLEKFYFPGRFNEDFLN